MAQVETVHTQRVGALLLRAPGFLLCACLALAPADALAARAVTTTVSPSVGSSSTVFRVSFRAGNSVNGGDGTYYEVRVKTSTRGTCRSGAAQYEVFATRGQRLTFSFVPGHRRWCRGSWAGRVYWVRDRNFNSGGCSRSPCVTRDRVSMFNFRV
jgi:hypothetical protein